MPPSRAPGSSEALEKKKEDMVKIVLIDRVLSFGQGGPLGMAGDCGVIRVRQFSSICNQTYFA